MAKSANRVVVVEDEEHIRTVVEYNLKQQGFDVYLASDGVCGLELVRRVLPDVVLLDWMMPEMDGLAVLTELKRDEATSDIPVLMLTAKGMTADVLKAHELGADDYITKPFDPTSLGETIRKKLEEPIEPASPGHSAGSIPHAKIGSERHQS